MNVTLFGATGRTGSRVLELVLSKGWAVKALVRDATKLATKHPLLTVIEGDASEAVAVAQALEGSQVVINAAGPVKGGHPELMTRLSKAVLSSITKKQNIRVIWLSGAGVALEGDRADVVRSIVRGIMKLVAGNVLRDSEQGVRTILELGNLATVIRVPMLTDKASQGRLVLSVEPSKPVAVARQELAKILVAQVEDPNWVGKAPFVGVA